MITLFAIYMFIGLMIFTYFVQLMKSSIPSLWDIEIYNLTNEINSKRADDDHVSYKQVEFGILLVGSLMFMAAWPVFLVQEYNR